MRKKAHPQIAAGALAHKSSRGSGQTIGEGVLRYVLTEGDIYADAIRHWKSQPDCAAALHQWQLPKAVVVAAI